MVLINDHRVLINDNLGVSEGPIRAVFRVYFLISFLLLGLVGSQVVKCVNKVRILQGQSLTMAQMTGWFQSTDIAKCLIKMRRLPGGPLLGSFMVLAALLAPVSDLLTSALVTLERGNGRCIFQTGLVIDISAMTWAVPPPNGYAALVAQSAQLASFYNGCSLGIYTKATLASDFCAEVTQDLLGTWSCEDVLKDHTFSSLLSVNEIATTLETQGLLYSGYSHTFDIRADNYTTQLILWSPSVGDQAKTEFTVKASIDQGFQYEADKVMKSYECHVDPLSADIATIRKILASMQAETTLSQWIYDLPSLIYDGSKSSATEYSTGWLELRLNSMTMVQGADAQAVNLPLKNPLRDDGKYGCWIYQISIHIVVIALAAAVLINLSGLILFWLILLMRIGRKGKEMEPFPNNQLTWMLHAARESVFGSQQHGVDISATPTKERMLRDWKFDWVSNGIGGRCLRLLKKSDPTVANAAVFSPSSTLFSPSGSPSEPLLASPPMKNTAPMNSPLSYPQSMMVQQWTQQHQYESVSQNQGRY